MKNGFVEKFYFHHKIFNENKFYDFLALKRIKSNKIVFFFSDILGER